MKRLIPQIIFFMCCLFLLDTSVLDAKIVFCIEDDIYVMDDNGTNRNKRRITKNTGETSDDSPRWSPDGERIAFVRVMDRSHTSAELFIMNADGTDVQRLTNNNVLDIGPSWSPDGTKITFDSTRSGRWEVHVIDLATLHITQLTSVEDGGGGAVAPDWSPDGTQIVYEKFTDDSTRRIYVMSANGEDQRPLLPDPNLDAVEFAPRWSADGQHILFDDCKRVNNRPRCIISITTKNGRGRVQQIKSIQEKFGHNFLVGTMCWMHNDKEIIFELKLMDKPNPNYDIYRYNFNTQRLIRLTRGEAKEGDPDWIEGTLSVSPQDKKKVTWGAIKE